MREKFQNFIAWLGAGFFTSLVFPVLATYIFEMLKDAGLVSFAALQEASVGIYRFVLSPGFLSVSLFFAGLALGMSLQRIYFSMSHHNPISSDVVTPLESLPPPLSNTQTTTQPVSQSVPSVPDTFADYVDKGVQAAEQFIESKISFIAGLFGPTDRNDNRRDGG